MDEQPNSVSVTRGDRLFHLIKEDYRSHTLERAVASSLITPEDAELIHEYVGELQSIRNISTGRANKITFALVNWRHHIGPYRRNTLGTLYAGIAHIKTVTVHGHAYKQNTLRDYVIFLKRFYRWLINAGHSSLPWEKIQQIHPPAADRMTKTASQLLTEEEVLRMIGHCRSSRDRAFISTLYEGGFRVKELGTLTWEQVNFDSFGAAVNVNTKTGKPRYVRLIAAVPYLVAWRNDYPFTPEGTALVFLTSQHRPLQHAGIALQLEKIAQRAGIRKHVTPHLFRHSRITHLLQQGYTEAVIKKIMWGSLSTDMLSTYGHLTSVDVDREVLQKMGMNVPKEREKISFEPRQCVVCQTINAPSARFCTTCGKPLTVDVGEEVDAVIRAIESTDEFRVVLELVKHTLQAHKIR